VNTDHPADAAAAADTVAGHSRPAVGHSLAAADTAEEDHHRTAVVAGEAGAGEDLRTVAAVGMDYLRTLAAGIGEGEADIGLAGDMGNGLEEGAAAATERTVRASARTTIDECCVANDIPLDG